jgi:hypothetical protein
MTQSAEVCLLIVRSSRECARQEVLRLVSGRLLTAEEQGRVADPARVPD